MAQINLLKQTSPVSNIWETLPSIIVKVLAAVLVVVLAYYGYLYFSSNKNKKDIEGKKFQMETDKATALGMKDRAELAVRQQQLKEYSGLMDKQTYWSQIMPVLASSTLNTAAYNSIKTSTDGYLVLTVTVPSLKDLDKFLQVFDLPQYYNNFNNVHISSYSKVQTATGTQIRFEVKFKYSPDIIKPSS